MNEPDDEARERVLPATQWVAVAGPTAPRYRALVPVAAFTVAPESDPRRYLTGDERRVADFLGHLGLLTRGVLEADTKRPDAVTEDRGHRIEFKTLATASLPAVQREARRGSLKARRVVLDLSETDLDTATAAAMLARIPRSLVGGRLDELGLLLGNDVLVAWSRYE